MFHPIHPGTRTTLPLGSKGDVSEKKTKFNINLRFCFAGALGGPGGPGGGPGGGSGPGGPGGGPGGPGGGSGGLGGVGE